MDNEGEELRKKESEIGASLYEGVGIGGKAKQVAGGLSETYRAASDQATAAREYAASIAGDFETAVRRSPLSWVLGALGVGLVIGSMRRR
jgi:hypothetical protein